MTFGKHKNQPISKLPTEYIEWFCGNVSGHDGIKAEMQSVLLSRWGGMKAKPKPGTPKVDAGIPVPQWKAAVVNLQEWDGASAPF